MKKLRMGWWMIVMALAGLQILFLGISEPSAAPQGVLKQAIHWSLSADYLDPATNIGGISAGLPLYLFHDTLVKSMPEGNLTPSLAESWTVSPDAKTYEFKLRRGVKFHNGDHLTAEDVVFSLGRYRAARGKTIQKKVEKVKAVNPNLVRIQFKDSFPDFMEHLLPSGSAMAWVAPKKYIEKVGEAEFKKNPSAADLQVCGIRARGAACGGGE